VLNVPTEYNQISASEFQQRLIKNYPMTEDVALDFTEQLLIFEPFGNVYARDEFVQAADVRIMLQVISGRFCIRMYMLT
jgi:hypothetical protein